MNANSRDLVLDRGEFALQSVIQTSDHTLVELADKQRSGMAACSLSALMTAFLLVLLVAESSAVTVPAKIEAEDYETAFDLSPGNTGGAYRTDNVDIAMTGDVGGGFVVGWIQGGEWLEYTIQVPRSSGYVAELRVASVPGSGSYTLEIDGIPVSGPNTLATTGGWQNWVTMSVDLGTLTAGEHSLRFAAQAGGFNLNWFNLQEVSVNRLTVPGRIQAESYNRFFDTTPGNQGNQLRSDDVDIGGTGDGGGGHAVAWIADAEWLEYDLRVDLAGAYDIDVRLASVPGNGSLRFEVDGSPTGTVLGVPATGSWNAYVTATASLGSLATGDHTLRVVMVGGGFNLNWFDLKTSQVTVDQCDTTSECKGIYGSQATDCSNSQSEQSVCLCGALACNAGPLPPLTPPPLPAPPSGDQCDTTAQCRISYGDAATDCMNSLSEQSVCMCGSAACTDAGGSDPDPDPSPGPGGMLGFFDRGSDLLLSFFDNQPDADDIHSQAGLGAMLRDYRLAGIDRFAVLGTVGRQGGRFLNSASVMNVCLGSNNWVNAYPKGGSTWNNALALVETRANAALARGGDVWIQEAGQSDFTAALLRRIKSSNPVVDTLNRIHVVQHSDFNENQTTPSELNYVRANADYIRIPDGNQANNGSPDFVSRNVALWDQAISEPLNGSCWSEARYIGSERNASASFVNPVIRDGGLDFSDTVEATYMFGFNSLAGSAQFFAEFPQSAAVQGSPNPVSSTFQEVNGLIVVEMESLGPAVGWQQKSGSGAIGSYLEWAAPDSFDFPGQGQLRVPIRITTPGIYRFLWRSSIRAGNDPTEHNDTWLKIDADSFYGQKSGRGLSHR
ncbi:MAG: carbohydrate-binding protein [Pseudomonadota bacterium]